MSEFTGTGIFASPEQLYQLAFCTPVMAVLPGGKVPEPKEDFRDMAQRFAVEAGLSAEHTYGIDPQTWEFMRFNQPDQMKTGAGS